MRGRRKQVKRRLKSEFAVFQSSSRLFHLAYFVESTRTLLELKSKSLKNYTSEESAQTAKKCTKKCDARAKLLFCLLN